MPHFDGTLNPEYCNVMSATDAYKAVYAQSDPGNGIGGYDLKSAADRCFAFDYDSSGKRDHIVLYRPGLGTVCILKNNNGCFTPVYATASPGAGIGGYDLRSPNDRICPFDYNHSGKADHLVIYRPGTGTIWILRNNGGNFMPVYAQMDPGRGIGGCNLASAADRIFAYDYDSCGRLDYLVIYRPGTGMVWILKNVSGCFTAVYAQTTGIGGYDLLSSADRAFAFDYEGNGKLDEIVLYRPGAGIFRIVQKNGAAFASIYTASSSSGGVAGYYLNSSADRCFAFDYDGGDALDELVIYRPGAGVFWVLQRNGTSYKAVYQQNAPGEGIGGYNFKSPVDRCFAFDYGSNGNPDHLVPYRPGTGTVWILERAY
ncbi:hypothetical protein NEOLEDRAFT_1171418 [Neolentinus lepideus HHB14362 ss-1]|uniref:Uncharacterized protein n=1 Tax=Neolentinus lepideus HHB14362 ss-1 TaxID=1314782 RepID=A0A165QH59_9AGAM|nr:hypothetical protein NEOLEDRAFT_1171418 [Neolentinus lepideus HHB14362 ss-1]